MTTTTNKAPRHGSPADRGSADAYYGRPARPHYYEGNTGTSPRIEREDMTDAEVQEYLTAYHGEDDRKDYGSDYDESPDQAYLDHIHDQAVADGFELDGGF